MHDSGGAEQGAGVQVRILGIPGSAREDSLNHRLLRAAAGLAPRGADLAIFDQPQAAGVPSFDPETELPPDVLRLRGAVEGSDALLVATPEYNGSLPGGLKNAIDWLTVPGRRGPLRGKPVAVVGADRGEIGCDWAQADARKVLDVAGARVIDDGLSIERAAEAFDDHDSLVNDLQAQRLRGILAELVSEGRLPG